MTIFLSGQIPVRNKKYIFAGFFYNHDLYQRASG